jgi:hypothetical protein
MEQWKGENLSKLMIKKMWNKKEKGIRNEFSKYTNFWQDGMSVTCTKIEWN